MSVPNQANSLKQDQPVLSNSDQEAKDAKESRDMMNREDNNTTNIPPNNHHQPFLSNEEVEDEVQYMMDMRRECILKECMKAKKNLDLSSSRIDDLDALTISMFLAERPNTFELVHLGTNYFTDEGLINILSGLQVHSNLKQLYLGNNTLTELGLSALIDTLPVFENLEILGLTNLGITDDLAVQLMYSLMELKKLKTLILNTNEIGNSGFTTLSILLASKSLPISSLHLGGNEPASTGIISLLKSLHSNNLIKTLNLNEISLNTESLKALSKMLVKNKSIEELNLGNCDITNEGIEILKSGLMFNSTLKTLHLWGNKIKDEGAKLLLEIIQDHNQTLVTVTLPTEEIDEEIVKDIKDLLKQNEGFTKDVFSEEQILKMCERGNKNSEKKQAENKDENNNDKEEDIKEGEEEEEENEEEDEKDLEELENEISVAEKDIEEEVEQHRAVKDKMRDEKREVLEKVWQGFVEQEKAKKDGLLHSTFN